MLLDAVKSFIDDESGATAIEYGLLAALIAIGLISTLGLIGNDVERLFNNGTSKVIAAQTDQIP